MFKRLLILFICFGVYGQASAQWTLSNSGISTFYDLRAIHFPTAAVGYTGGAQTFYKTTNGGSNWINGLNAIPTGYRTIEGIHFINKDTGFACGWSGLNSNNAPTNGFILRTLNGGTSWTVVKSQAAGPIFSVKFISPTHGFAAGGAPDGASNLFATTDGGTTWTTVSTFTGLNLYIFDLAVTPSGVVHMCGMLQKTSTDFREILFRKAAGSNTVDTMTFDAPLFCTMYRGIRAINDNEIFTVGNKCFAKSTNGGSSWTTASLNNANPNGGSFECLAFTSNLNGWAGGTGGDFYKTTDGGANWSAVTLGTGVSLYDIFFPNATTGFVVGDAGTVYKYTGTTTPNNVAPTTSAPALRVFPNPTASQVSVEGVNESYNATLLTVNGQVARTQLITPAVPTMDCSALPGGMYFLILRNQKGAQVFSEKVVIAE